MLRCPAKEEMSSLGERQEEPRVVVGRQSAPWRGGVCLLAHGTEGDGLLERQVGAQAVQDVTAGDEYIARVDVERQSL